MNFFFTAFTLLLSIQVEASTYDPGPPPLFDNFQISDEIFLGTVLFIEDSNGNRGDSIASIEVIESLKGDQKVGETVKLGFNLDCPFLVRSSDCKRHTLPLKVEDQYVFFARNKFTSRSYGTLLKSNVWPSILALKEGYSHFQADLLRGFYMSVRVSFIGEAIESKSGLNSNEESRSNVRVISSFSEKLSNGQQIEVRGWGQPLTLRKASLFVLNQEGDEFRLDSDPQSMENFKKRANDSEERYKRRFNFRERHPKLTSVEAGGYIPGFRKYTDALTSIFNLMHNSEFHVGFQAHLHEGAREFHGVEAIRLGRRDRGEHALQSWHSGDDLGRRLDAQT
jgi:hypothetical protein